MNADSEQLIENILLRPADLAEDKSFLKRLFFSTRQADAEAWVALGEEQAGKLLEMQYRGQQLQYAQDFPDAEYYLVLFEEKRVGRMIVSRSKSEIRGVDLALLPEYRNHGIGTIVLRHFFDEAAECGRIFTFHVLKTNRAIRLYERLGCQVIGDTGSHLKMKKVWRV